MSCGIENKLLQFIYHQRYWADNIFLQIRCDCRRTCRSYMKTYVHYLFQCLFLIVWTWICVHFILRPHSHKYLSNTPRIPQYTERSFATKKSQSRSSLRTGPDQIGSVQENSEFFRGHWLF